MSRVCSDVSQGGFFKRRVAEWIASGVCGIAPYAIRWFCVSRMGALKFLAVLQIAKHEFSGRAIVQSNNRRAGDQICLTGDDRIAGSAIGAGYRCANCNSCCSRIIGAGATQPSGVEDLKGSAGKRRGRCALCWLAIELTIYWQRDRASCGKRHDKKRKFTHDESFVSMYRTTGAGMRVLSTLCPGSSPISILGDPAGCRNTVGTEGRHPRFVADWGQARLHVAPVSSLMEPRRVGAACTARPFFQGGCHA